MYLHFSSLPAIPITLHPAILANCPTNCPTAPDAADTTTLSPGTGQNFKKSKVCCHAWHS